MNHSRNKQTHIPQAFLRPSNFFKLRERRAQCRYVESKRINIPQLLSKYFGPKVKTVQSRADSAHLHQKSKYLTTLKITNTAKPRYQSRRDFPNSVSNLIAVNQNAYYRGRQPISKGMDHRCSKLLKNILAFTSLKKLYLTVSLESNNFDDIDERPWVRFFHLLSRMKTLDILHVDISNVSLSVRDFQKAFIDSGVFSSIDLLHLSFSPKTRGNSDFSRRDASRDLAADHLNKSNKTLTVWFDNYKKEQIDLLSIIGCFPSLKTLHLFLYQAKVNWPDKAKLEHSSFKWPKELSNVILNKIYDICKCSPCSVSRADEDHIRQTFLPILSMLKSRNPDLKSLSVLGCNYFHPDGNNTENCFDDIEDLNKELIGFTRLECLEVFLYNSLDEEALANLLSSLKNLKEVILTMPRNNKGRTRSMPLHLLDNVTKLVIHDDVSYDHRDLIDALPKFRKLETFELYVTRKKIDKDKFFSMLEAFGCLRGLKKLKMILSHDYESVTPEQAKQAQETLDSHLNKIISSNSGLHEISIRFVRECREVHYYSEIEFYGMNKAQYLA